MEHKELTITSDLDIEQEEIEIIGVHTLCRLCSSQNDKLIGIYSEEGIGNDLSNKINLYLPIKVTATDELPLQCCWNCASTLLAWHELVITSVETDRRFRGSQFIATEKQIIEGPSCDSSAHTASDDNDADGPESKTMSTSLNDFSQSSSSPDPKNSSRSPKKRRKHLPMTLYPLQESTPLDGYMSDIEHQLISPELVENPEYKIDIENENILTDDENKSPGPEIKSYDSMSFKLDREEERPYFGCQYCPAIFFVRKSIIEHVKEEHGKKFDKSFIEHVPKQTTAAGTVKKEKRKHNKIDQELINSAKVVVDGRIYYNCKECGKNLHSPYTYVWHMRIHTGERPYVCDLCGKQFRVSQGLVRHLRETHEGIKKFPCDLCGRMFATRRNVEEHRRIHTNERPYVCDLCGKSFKQKASLFVHKRSHKNYFPFKCSYCNQGFRTKPPLLVHITRHTGEKPYKCDICSRCFRIKYELKRHRLIHSDEKPWVCNICGFSFRQKRYLRNHTKSNHTLVA